MFTFEPPDDSPIADEYAWVRSLRQYISSLSDMHKYFWLSCNNDGEN